MHLMGATLAIEFLTRWKKKKNEQAGQRVRGTSWTENGRNVNHGCRMHSRSNLWQARMTTRMKWKCTTHHHYNQCSTCINLFSLHVQEKVVVRRRENTQWGGFRTEASKVNQPVASFLKVWVLLGSTGRSILTRRERCYKCLRDSFVLWFLIIFLLLS